MEQFQNEGRGLGMIYCQIKKRKRNGVMTNGARAILTNARPLTAALIRQ